MDRTKLVEFIEGEFGIFCDRVHIGFVAKHFQGMAFPHAVRHRKRKEFFDFIKCLISHLRR